MITCHYCGSKSIQHYRQLRKDRIWVVTARCENGHIPEKGKPFYSVALFDVASLPVLKNNDPNDGQIELFVPVEKESKEPPTLLEWFEEKQKRLNQWSRQ